MDMSFLTALMGSSASVLPEITLGIGTGVAATFVAAGLKHAVEHRHYKLEGLWIEKKTGDQHGAFSLVRISYDLFHGFKVDGHAFRPDGTLEEKWVSNLSRVDKKNLRLHYEYSSDFPDETPGESYGYAVLKLAECNGKIVPICGEYTNLAKGDDPVKYRMVKAPKEIRSLQATLGTKVLRWVRRIINNKNL